MSASCPCCDLDIEDVLDPALPIVDAHHHLWLIAGDALRAAQAPDNPLGQVISRHARYLLDEYLADTGSGHDVRASVYVDAHAMYRNSGPAELRSLGEVEFAAGVAACCESGSFGPTHVAAAIVGNADLSLGDAVAPVLETHIAAAGGRYRGVRNSASYDADPAVLGSAGRAKPHVLLDPQFRRGFGHLHRHRLSFDVWVLEPQLPEVVDLAAAFPDTRIILNHLATPLGCGRYAGRREERFDTWRANLKRLADCPNVAVKLGGLGLPFTGFAYQGAAASVGSEILAEHWRPYVETAIDCFGVARCMFESNFPVDAGAGSYRTLWNAFKRIAAGYSHPERLALFGRTATDIYRITPRNPA